MADAVMAAQAPPDAARSAPSSAVEAADIVVSDFSPDVISSYQTLDMEGIRAPAQSGAWIDSWLATNTPDSLFAAIRDHGKPVFALALEVIRSGPFRVARFMSGTHANGNFALAAPDYLAKLSPDVMHRLASAIGKARPDVDVLMLERLLPDLDGVPNPLLALPHTSSPNPALAVDLAGGFSTVVSGPSGKRKRKKHRTQTRKYEAAGGFRRMEAQSVEDVHRLLDAFFGMKTARFRKAGIVNVFAEPQVQDFFRKLFCEALPLSPKPFVLHGLVVGGKLRAVTGSSVCGRRLICEFGSIAEDDMMVASPGEFLFYENIQEACDQGLSVYDFSVGDELYKRLWCDIEIRHLDVLAPLTVKGRLFAGSMRLFATLKAGIKNNPTVWRLTKSLRRQAIGKKNDSDTPNEG